MNICIIGCGYVGLTCAVCFSNFGNRVIGLDNDEVKVRLLVKKKPPIYEPHLADLLVRAGDNISFTTDPSVLDSVEVIFVAVPTPVSKEGQWELNYIKTAAESIGRNITSYKVIINKCTAPIGTAETISKFIIQAGAPYSRFDVLSNPEFLKEGSAISDFLHPHRIVIGGSSQKAIESLLQLYQPIVNQDFPFDASHTLPPVSPPIPVIITDSATAEMIKYASNAFLASKISFINEIGNICKRKGIDVYKVAKGLGLDPRISPHFLEAGLGFGGSCLPKDARALITMAKEVGYEPLLFQAVLDTNKKQVSTGISHINSN